MGAHQCQQCSRTFSRPENLKRHRKAHSRVLPHRCQLCPKTFSRTDLLKKHEAVHQNARRSVGNVTSASDQAATPWSPAYDSPGPSPAASRANDTFHALAGDGDTIIVDVNEVQTSPNDTGYHPNTSESTHLDDGTSQMQLRCVSHRLQAGQAGLPQRTQHGQLALPLPRGYQDASQVISPSPTVLQDPVYEASHFQATVSSQNTTSHQDPLGMNTHLDYSSYMHPWMEQESAGPSQSRNTGDWFTFDFYQALFETSDGEIGQDLNLSNLHFSDLNGYPPHENIAGYNPSHQSWSRSMHPMQQQQQQPQSQSQSRPQTQIQIQLQDGDHRDSQDNTAPISRVPSPPNVPSNEDNWAFAWNPSSAAVRQSQPIQVQDDDPLFVNHDTRHDIQPGTWQQVKAFVWGGNNIDGDNASALAGFTLPSLKIVNAFIGLFFKHFLIQAPVLHEPTMIMDGLPPPLLVIMIVIGAKYSHLRHTRRFSILLLDRARRNLQTAIENDSRLVRNTHVIFAYSLICYTGLWCGNKRAFEIAESLRGTLVTYVRRLPCEETFVSSQAPLESQWSTWATAETRRRLKWFVFTLDSQFPVLLNIRGMFTTAETCNWELPCEDEFWSAPTARVWKSMLGMAPIPPTPQFSFALLPFLPSLVCGAASKQPDLHYMRLNSWSSFLVLTVISSCAFEWSQDWALANMPHYETTSGNISAEEGVGGANSRCGTKGLQERKSRLADAITLWYHYYGSRTVVTTGGVSRLQANISEYFRQASYLAYQQTQMLLNVSLSDLQLAMGKDGPRGVQLAKWRLKSWFSVQCQTDQDIPLKDSEKSAEAHREEQIVESVVNGIQLILHIGENSLAGDAVPYSLIGLFLAHVTLWAFAFSSAPVLRQQLRQRIAQDVELSGRMTRQLSKSLEAALADPNLTTDADQSEPRVMNGPRAILKHGAQVMTRLGTWGASLNLALLLHRRADMESYIMQS